MTANLLSEISQAAMTVDNVDRAVNFYRDTLGLKLLFRVPNMAFFECGSMRILMGARAVAGGAPAGAILYFKVDDMTQAHHTLTQRGVKFAEPQHIVARMADREVWLAAFRDSENNLFHLISEKPV